MIDVQTLPKLDPTVAEFVTGPRRMLIDGAWVDAVSGKTFLDSDNNGSLDPGELGVVSQFVYLDANGNNQFDGAGTWFSGAVHVAIPDNDPGGCTSSIVVPNTGLGLVTDVNVTINITHSFIDDLEIRLSNGVKIVDLMIHQGAQGDDPTNMIFDDDAVDLSGFWLAAVVVLEQATEVFAVSKSDGVLTENLPRPEHLRARMLSGKTVGLIGFGQIAQAVAARLSAWNCRLIATVRTPRA